jgi:hypothetical protein
MRKRICLAVLAFGLVVAPAAPALACAGLFDPNGAVKLGRTNTLAAHYKGVEHYVTAFKYSGGGGEFGSIVPLPAMPSKVEKGGDWTLQRLEQESPGPTAASGAARLSSAESDTTAEEVYKTRIDALDITVLKGGGKSVGIWAADHGFRLPPDAPEVLDFYGARSPFFMAAVFDAKAAEDKGQEIGDGTTIHITIPLRDPWVPLRILGLGKEPSEFIEANVYLLTERVPNLLPSTGRGYSVQRQVVASKDLLEDLRSDRGMEWMPTSGMTFTHLIVGSTNPQLRYDLATDVHGGAPSAVLAGLAAPPTPEPPTPAPTQAPTPEATATPAPSRLPEQALAEPASDSRSAWPMALATTLVVIGAAAAVTMRRIRARDHA